MADMHCSRGRQASLLLHTLYYKTMSTDICFRGISSAYFYFGSSKEMADMHWVRGRHSSLLLGRTACLKSSDPILYNKLLCKTGHYFLEIQCLT